MSLRHRFMHLFIIFSIVCLNATTKISIVNGNWNSPSTWSPSGVPASTDNIVINTNVILNTNINLDAGSSLTINSGKSLIGASNINTDGTIAGPNIAIINNGTLTIDELQASDECAQVSIDNYGNFSVVGNASVTVFTWRGGIITNHAGGTFNVPNKMFRLSNQDYVSSSCPNERPTFDNYGIANFWDIQFHANSIGINRSGGIINTIAGGPGIFLAAYNFDNYGCIIANSDIELNGKTNNNGHNQSTVHDGSKIVVITGSFSITGSGHILTGVDDNGDNSDNGCISTVQAGTQITNAGTITGELYLNDPDGNIPGTVGPLVVKGTSNCGGNSCCTNPNCGTGSIIKN